MSKKEIEIEVLAFRKDHEFATVVTDGDHHMSFELEQSQAHPTLLRAIGYLEARGYSIQPDLFHSTKL